MPPCVRTPPPPKLRVCALTRSTPKQPHSMGEKRTGNTEQRARPFRSRKGYAMSTVNVLVRDALRASDASERARLTVVAISAMDDEWNEMRELLARHEEVFGRF